MPRRRRHEKISDYHLGQIERQVSLLEIELGNATLTLAPFCTHYNAIADLNGHLRAALNLLNDRPADYVRPHRAPMSGP